MKRPAGFTGTATDQVLLAGNQTGAGQAAGDHLPAPAEVRSWQGGDQDPLRAEQAGGHPALRGEEELQRWEHPALLSIGKSRYGIGVGNDPRGSEWRRHQT